MNKIIRKLTLCNIVLVTIFAGILNSSSSKQREYVEVVYFNDVRVEIPHKNDKVDGIERVYYENGKLRAEIPHKNDKIDGIEKKYYENGMLEIETPYKNGQEEGNKRKYYENGMLEIETPYKNGKKDGIERKYYENGTLEYETSYKNGKKDGIEKKYYPDGIVYAIIPYTAGLRDGRMLLYYRNGKLQIDLSYFIMIVKKQKVETIGNFYPLEDYYYYIQNDDKYDDGYDRYEIIDDGIIKLFDSNGEPLASLILPMPAYVINELIILKVVCVNGKTFTGQALDKLRERIDIMEVSPLEPICKK